MCRKDSNNVWFIKNCERLSNTPAFSLSYEYEYWMVMLLEYSVTLVKVCARESNMERIIRKFICWWIFVLWQINIAIIKINFPLKVHLEILVRNQKSVINYFYFQNLIWLMAIIIYVFFLILSMTWLKSMWSCIIADWIFGIKYWFFVSMELSFLDYLNKTLKWFFINLIFFKKWL